VGKGSNVFFSNLEEKESMVETKYIHLQTEGKTQVINITSLVEQKVKGGKISDGVVIVFVPGATGGVTTIEYEPGVVADLKNFLEEIIPERRNYRHNLNVGDDNGHSHLRAGILGPSLTIPFLKKELQLGTWQKIVFLDFDTRPRTRKIICQLMGE
jgi:secondary thiamine-phosphate synthase enzyme